MSCWDVVQKTNRNLDDLAPILLPFLARILSDASCKGAVNRASSECIR